MIGQLMVAMHTEQTDKTERWNGILQTIPVQLLLPRQQKESRLH